MISCDTCGEHTHERSLVAVNGGFHCAFCAPDVEELEGQNFDSPPAAEGQSATETAQSGSVWVAQYESARFQFMAVGMTAKLAVCSLHKGLEDHATQFKLLDDWFFGDDITITRIELGQTLRDREVIRV